MKANKTPIKSKMEASRRSPNRRSPNRKSPSKMLSNYKKKVQDFNPTLYITSRISQEDVLQIKQAFDSYDSNGVGHLTPNDLKNALFHQNFHASKETLYDIIAECDQQCLGGLNFAAFMKIISNEPTQMQTQTDLKKVFRKLDRQNKGFLDHKDIWELTKKLGQNMDEMQVDELINKMDKTHSGKIDFDTFCQVMHNPKSYY